MLVQMANTAVVQIIQAVLLAFFVVLCMAVVNARLHLPKTKVEPLLDVGMVLVILVYAVVLKIYFST